MDTYEKKYKNALTIAQSRFKIEKDESVLTCLGMMFPELRESEDERIRKEIISIVKQYGRICEKEGDHCYTIGDCLSYLEKQKEQKPEIKYVYPKFRKGDVIEPITPNGHFTPVRVVGIWDGSYSCRSDDDKAYLSLPIKHEDEYRLVEQKPAEWSEEDADILNCCISSIEEAKENRYAYKETDGDTSYDHEIAWLKSLRPVSKESLQSHWKPSEEQMMKEAVEGEVKDFCFVREVNYSSAKIEFSTIPELKVGDKVRVIIAKED